MRPHLRTARLVTTLGVAALAAAGTLVGATPAGAIVGGSPVPDGSYRFMASIQTRGSSGTDGHFCGGSVVAKRWVLTAAHCMTEEDGTATRPGTLQVVVGRTDLTQGKRGQTVRVDRVRVHPKYASTGTHDVALLHTTRAMDVPRIRLAGTGGDALEQHGTALTVAGWGTELFGAPTIPARMKSVRVSAVADSRCVTNALMGFNAATEICAEKLLGDSCQGDSGGPLFGTTADGRRLQVGVVSYGLGCATPLFPGVYAEVNNPAIRAFITRISGV